jgi:hypothetical protein
MAKKPSEKTTIEPTKADDIAAFNISREMNKRGVVAVTMEYTRFLEKAEQLMEFSQEDLENGCGWVFP